MNNYKKHLKYLTESVNHFLRQLDKVMWEPPAAERGKKIAELTNQLEIQNDSAMRFGLNYGWEKINKIKEGD